MCNESLATASCQPCPEGLTCPAGLDPPVQQPGFWAEPTACNFKVLRCRNQLECPGLALGECAKGRDGIACNNCHFNHYPLENGTCELCGPGDYWPSILAGLIGVLVAILLVRSAKVDLNQQSLNLLTVAAVASQTITALQALGSIRKLAVEWIYPVRRIIELTKIVSFDLDVIKISCILGQDSPTLKFIGQLLLWPMGLGVFLTCWLISQLRGDKMSLDTVFQLGGVLVFALFISITLAVLDPFLCIQNPDGSSSMASSPGVVCFNSEEHVWLAFLSSLGILCYPLLVLSWATFTTLMYPSRINSGAGLKLVRRHGFLFQRFTRECYFYGTLLLLRNIIVSLVPVAFAAVPEVQMVIMGAVLVTFGAVQVRLWPWRTTLANYTDLAITFILQVVLLGIAPLLEVEEGVSTEILGWILTFSVLSPFVAGIAASTFCVLCHFHPPLDYGIFLCHHKGGAGSLCRLIKLLISNHSKTRVFLDSDELEDLDLIFDTIRLKTRSVVVVLTPELLTRMWCAGEIVTAFKNKVITVPLICDGYLPPSTADIEGIPEVWTVQQKQILSFYGITMEDVQRAYAWLHDELEALILSRFAPPHHRENTVVELLSMVRAPMLYFRSMDGTKAANHKVKARVLITGAVSDGEALATLEVFQIMLQKQLHKECAVVQTPTALVAYKPWAYYFVILLSRGMLRDPGFAETLLSAYVEGEGVSSRPLEMVTVNADTHFEFPSAEFYRDLEEHSLPGVELHLGPHLSKAYRAMLNVLALPLSPMGSEGLLTKQVAEIARRFRRYQSAGFAESLDDEDDREAGGDGVNPHQLQLEMGSLPDQESFLSRAQARKSLKRIGKSVAYTETGALIQLDLDDLSEASDDHPLITESATAEVQATAPWPEGPDVSGPLAEGELIRESM